MDETEILIKYKEDLGPPLFLTREEEIELTKKLRKGDREAAQILIRANGRGIIKMASKYHRNQKKINLLDLIQEGNIGFLRGAKKFKSKFDCKLYTYASWWAWQAIISTIYDYEDTIHIPRHIVLLINKFFKVRNILFNRLGYEPSLEEISIEIGVPIEEIKEIAEYSKIKKVSSLNRSIKDKNHTPSRKKFLDGISDLRRKNPEELTIIMELKEVIKRKISVLPKREWEIIKKRFQIGIMAEKTLDNLGQRFSVTRERIRQIEKSILKKLYLDTQDKKEKFDDYI